MPALRESHLSDFELAVWDHKDRSGSSLAQRQQDRLKRLEAIYMNTDWEPCAPDAGRVAARAIVLAGVACRGLIENEKLSDEIGAEDLRQRIVTWIENLGVNTEMEANEAILLATPVGRLDRRPTIDATWRSEGLAVLAWALHRTALPPVHSICEPVPIANALGFLRNREMTPLFAPHVRQLQELEYWADTYLTLHWRLRQFSIEPGKMDFASYASNCNWARMRLDELELIEGDLAIKGVRIDAVDQDAFHDALSITRERRVALDWLLGFESLYSEVTTDT